MIDKKIHNLQIKEIDITKYRSGDITKHVDFVAEESPLQIKCDSKAMSITMRTPGDDIALTLGFMFTEGLLKDFDEVADVVHEDDNTVNVMLEAGTKIEAKNLERNFYSTSSCGVCGKASVDAIMAQSMYSQAENDMIIDGKILFALQEKLLAVQSAFKMTGGLHACAIFSPEGDYLFHSEDVGRHNALDKLIGHAFMAGRIPLDKHLLLLSGRASFELIQKASMAGISCIVAVGAPSSLAVELAKENKLTLVGFLKKSGFNIYSGSQRIL